MTGTLAGAPVEHVPDPDRLLPAEPSARQVARELYAETRSLPIVSPHGHVDPAILAGNRPFADPAELFVIPDHYVTRMLHSAGIPLEELGRRPLDGGGPRTQPREVWRLLARHWHLFRATPTRLWLEHALHETFGVRERLSPESADRVYDQVADCLARPEFRPRELFEQFGIEVLTTTEGAAADLRHHRALTDSGWGKRVLTAFRPDAVVDAEQPGWRAQLDLLGEATGEDVHGYRGYLAALAGQRRRFAEVGCTSTDHGHPTAATVELSGREGEALFAAALAGPLTAAQAETWRGHMLLQFARMSCEDGLVMQIHPGSCRNHDTGGHSRFGRDIGADIPTPTEYVAALRPLLNRYGHVPGFTLVVFTLDESTYSRELAPLAGYYPAMKLGAPWWFNDSPEGMRRFRETTTETAGFFNTVGFTDDTRAFPSIPARHDAARRVDAAYLARLVTEGRLPADEAADTAVALAYTIPKEVYKL